MKVILKQDVLNLGEEGDVCEVARGYARNYLVPQGFAMLYNRANVAQIEARRAAIEQRKGEKRKAAQEISERLTEQELVFNMNAGESGKLFGAVTSAMIVEELGKQDVVVERKNVDIPEGTIKSVGTHKVGVKLYGDKETEITVRVSAANAPQGESGASASEAREEAKEPEDNAVSQAAAETEEAPAAEESAGDASVSEENNGERS